MDSRTPRILLIVWVVLFFLSFLLLSTAGDYWPWYAIMAIVAIFPMLHVGPFWQRIAGVVAFLFSLFLIFSDIWDGKEWAQRRQRHLEEGTRIRALENATNQVVQSPKIGP